MEQNFIIVDLEINLFKEDEKKLINYIQENLRKSEIPSNRP